MKTRTNIVLPKIKEFPPVIWMLAVMALFFGVTQENYFSAQNMLNILRQSVPLLIVSFGQTLIVLTQGTDLSLGAQVSFVTVIWVFLSQAGVNIYLSAVIAIVLVMCVGMLNGILVSKGKIPAFIATFGVQNIVNSISLLITAGSSIYFSHVIFQTVYESSILWIPVPIWITVLMFVLTWMLLYRTKFGINIFGLGGNQEALVLAGVSTTKSYVKTYAFASFLAGVAGIIVACRVESGQPTVGTGWEFEAVAATLLGGTSLREGKGGIGGTIFGVLLLNMLRNGLNISGVSAMYQNAIIGIIVLLAIVLDAMIRRNRG